MRTTLAVVLLLAAAANASAQRAVDCVRWDDGRRFTLVTDSVLLGAYQDLKRDLRGWTMRMHGKVSMTVPDAERYLRRRSRRVAPLVVVGLGYNSNWQQARENFGFWAGHFDRQSRALLRTLRRLGARQVVWVNLREPALHVIPSEWRSQFFDYAWYFPYVNERLRRLARADDRMVLADWRRAGRRGGITHDAIHLNRAGARLMARTIERAITGEARRQSRACG